MKHIRVEFIVDSSGSMEPQKNSVIDGLNNQIKEMAQEELQNPDIRYLVSLTTFSSFTKTVYQKTPVSEVKPLDAETYVPSGMTALYDAIGSRLDTAEEGEVDVLVYVYTDGHENCSQTFDWTQVSTLTKYRQDQGWGITYFGANQNAQKVAKDLGIRNSVSYAASDFSGALGHSKSIRASYAANVTCGVSGSAKSANLTSDINDPKFKTGDN